MSTLRAAVLMLAASWVAAEATIPNTVTFRNFFRTATDSLVFNRPVFFAQYPGQDSTYIVLEQPGQIVTVAWNGTTWTRAQSAAITVTGGSGTGYYEERGLLGFAFHPEYETNPRYYVYYMTGSTTVLAERIATGMRPATGDPQRNLLVITQPDNNHNGGTIGFGPDGYLYIGTGDGGGSGDTQNRAQNRNSLLGKMLRIDVNTQDPGKEYAVPADNPFIDSAGTLPEIWALGLRNPWRWTFNPVTGQLWAADVGQSAREVVTRVPRGGNLGWRIWEGTFCHGGNTACNNSTGSGMIPPLFEYNTGNAWGRSISGGAFFRGDSTAAFHNTYIVGDYISNRVWAIRAPETEITADSAAITDPLTLIGTVNNVVSIERDTPGRIFAVSLSSTAGGSISANQGRVFILESPDMVLAPTPVNVHPGKTLREASFRPISPVDYLRTPERFEVRGLDGRALRGNVSGAVWVREKGSSNPPQLITIVQ